MADDLKCGNCGHDGGLAHAAQKLEWQEKIHKAQRGADITSESRIHRYWTSGI